MNVFELFATLSLDTSEYDKALDDSEEKGSSFASKLGKGLKTAGGVAMGAMALTGAATVAVGKEFISGVSDVAAYADNIDKMSQKMNMSAEAYQEWDFIMQHSGTTIESMQASIKTLSNAAETNSEAFAALGLSQEEIASMSGEELFSATITALQGVSDETQRTYLAGQLLGRGATELGALLNTSAEDTELMRQQAHELGGVLSDDAVKGGAQFQDSLQNMQTALSGVKNNMLSQFLPAFSTTMDGLANVFSGKPEEGLAQIEEGVNNLATTMTAQMPTFIRIGGSILTALVSSISQNLPTLVQTGLSVVKQLASAIISNLPTLASAAVDIIKELATFLADPTAVETLIDTALIVVETLATGLGEALPVLVPAVVNIILAIVEKLTEPDMMETLTTATFTLMGGLISGIIQAIPSIVATIPTLVANIVSTTIQSFPVIISNVLTLIGNLGSSVASALANNLGTDLSTVSQGISNIKTKISEGLQAALSTVTSVLTSIKTKFTSIFTSIKTTVANAITAVKNAFNFSWSLPELKLPHISVTGGEAPWGIGGKGSLPTFDIQWYRKAYDDAYMLNNPTIFGFAGGTLLGGGEGTGGEMIMGEEYFRDVMMDAASRITIQPVITVYVAGEEMDGYTVSAEKRISLVSGGRG